MTDINGLDLIPLCWQSSLSTTKYLKTKRNNASKEKPVRTSYEKQFFPVKMMSFVKERSTSAGTLEHHKNHLQYTKILQIRWTCAQNWTKFFKQAQLHNVVKLYRVINGGSTEINGNTSRIISSYQYKKFDSVKFWDARATKKAPREGFWRGQTPQANNNTSHQLH